MKLEQNEVVLGYYICKIIDTPDFLNNISKKIISVSDCICEHEPQIFLCHGWKPNGDNEEYRKKCNLSMKQYIEMSEKITRLCCEEKFFTDGRFLSIEDARYFYEKYFFHYPNMLISFVVEDTYLGMLGDDFKLAVSETTKGEYEHIGYDIIGWDISGFHSFLCNSLHKEYDNIRFNSYGLLDMEYKEVKRIANEIQRMGEPVDWIPVTINKIQHFRNI